MNSKQQYTPVRFSHLTSYSGVGAIVRGAGDKLMVVADTRYWTDKDKQNTTTLIPYVNRITQSLGIKQELRMPPTAQEIQHKGNKEIEGSYLPAVLFPTYASCPKCGLLHPNPWRNQDKILDEKVECQECKSILRQVVWCCVSNQGFLDDVPWHAICHGESKSICKTDYRANYLKFSTNNNGEKIIQCIRCNSSNIYEKQRLGFIGKQQPWIYEPAELEEGFEVKIVEVNDSSAYSPESVKALVIPPESRISKSTIVDRLYNNSIELRDLQELQGLRKKSKLKKLATKYRCTKNEIENAIQKIDDGYPNFGNFETSGDLIVDEYKAFLAPLKGVKDDEDFVTEHKTSEWKILSTIEQTNLHLTALIQVVNNHIVAKRLREILVFKGFKRGFAQEGQEQPLVPPDIIGESNWLPAIELFGEGVFFTLDEAILSAWENLSSIKQRVKEINERYEDSSLNLGQDVVITPRFILLHTLAHLIIRELETSAGYPAASLNERIYHSRSEKMAGILIYTAVPDVIGSLGGIVESAQPKEFLKILNNAFKQAQWCSLDPVCTEHKGQGPSWLNRAACHSCALVPETACDYSNVFLDRVFIKGSAELNIPNFLDFVINRV